DTLVSVNPVVHSQNTSPRLDNVLERFDFRATFSQIYINHLINPE
ncbi:614_t:CDS:1, partial [Funneliformis caledonium]